jgi:hypothetical protein
MKEIPMVNGGYAIVDDCDFDLVCQYTWFKTYESSCYAVTTGSSPIRMHRMILGLVKGDGRSGDHIDGNGLNNTRANIRVCTHAENSRNKGLSSANSSGYKGVSYLGGGKWKVSISKMRKAYISDVFSDPIEAARFYDISAMLLFGKFARLNFPNWPDIYNEKAVGTIPHKVFERHHVMPEYIRVAEFLLEYDKATGLYKDPKLNIGLRVKVVGDRIIADPIKTNRLIGIVCTPISKREYKFSIL